MREGTQKKKKPRYIFLMEKMEKRPEEINTFEKTEVRQEERDLCVER